MSIRRYYFNEKSYNEFKESISNNLKETFNPEPISNKTMDIEKEILKFTNIERTNYGLNPLKWDDKLTTIAREHSLDMVENDFFEHKNLRGEEPTDRAIRHKYPIIKNYGSYYTEGIGENIGTMETGNVIGHGYVDNDPQSIAKEQVKSWMNSPGHKENILTKSYTNIGVGVAYDGSTYYIATQNFW